MSGTADLIRALELRASSMSKNYQAVDSSFRDVAKWVDPARGQFFGESRNADKAKAFIVDPEARKAYRTTKAGLMSGLSSPTMPWFKLKAPSFEKPTHEIAVWLDDVARIIFEVLATSNAYAALKLSYADLTLFGCYAGINRFSRDNVVHVQSLPVGAYLWDGNDEERIDTLHWTVDMSVRQMVERFGLDKVSDRVKGDWENNRHSQTYKVNATIQPRLTLDPLKPRVARNMPVSVYYWEKGETQKLLHEGGLEVETSIMGPRWETMIGNPWPTTSPARDALPDIKKLQRRTLDRDEAVQMSFAPPMGGPAIGATFSYRPRAYNVMTATEQANRPQPLFQPQLNVQHLDMGIQDTRSAVSEAFYATLFRIASEYGVQGVKDVTAYAIQQLKEEQLMVLGPVLDSVDRGLLAPLIETTFHHCQEAGLLPPAPQDLAGAAVAVEFTGLLFQAQKALGVAPTERMIGFAGTLAQVVGPQVLQNFNGDEILRDFATSVGFSADNLRDPDLVEEERKVEAEAMQQQQMMQAAPQMAQAANLLSEASARGQEGMQQQGIL